MLSQVQYGGVGHAIGDDDSDATADSGAVDVGAAGGGPRRFHIGEGKPPPVSPRGVTYDFHGGHAASQQSPCDDGKTIFQRIQYQIVSRQI